MKHVPMIVFVSAIGAVLSWALRSGKVPWWTLFLASMSSAIVWTYLVRVSALTLTRLSLVFDACMSLSYLAVFAFLGDRLTYTQALGALLVLAGMYLLR